MSQRPLIVITDCGFPSAHEEKRAAEDAGIELKILDHPSPETIKAETANADAVINQHVELTADIIASMKRCRAIVRYGIGYENVDVDAATQAGITVCNVPDYGVGEVAEHALSLALALARQLPQTDAKNRRGEWSYVTPAPAQPFSNLTLITAGFGRIARMLHRKASTIGFQRAAYDPFVDEATFTEEGVRRVSLDEMFTQADILSLHLPVTNETRHLVDADRLMSMKSTAILINTARGALVDSEALAAALKNGELGGAGIDVYEEEPPSREMSLFGAPNTILTTHTAWYSEESIGRLQRLAAEEAVRAARGEALRCPVNTPATKN